jgi:hypothetical protein
MISVPIIRSGALQGYVMTQFSFTGDARAMKHLSVKADTVVIDEGFKAIYGDEVVDFRKMKKQDLPDLGKRIVEGANKRLGAHIIEDVFLQELNYVSKEGTRSGAGGGAHRLCGSGRRCDDRKSRSIAPEARFVSVIRDLNHT